MRPLVVREATEADAALLHGWRDDPVTRGWSRDTGEVPYADHVAWLRRVLESADRVLLVAEHDGDPAGTVRFDQEDPGVWEVSITLAPEYRGRGMAGALLAAGERALGERRQVRRVLATVHRENAASVALFERAGYVAVDSGSVDSAALAGSAETAGSVGAVGAVGTATAGPFRTLVKKLAG